ncbi:GNAT family N-acetyltransferase [Cryobacterium ruanii]|uniref:GNAT family N-acetyltransferase n=1 Tax=Cryobacterium ruanii TaxID=1259197 RepID=A0A4R9AMX8_9MICO|nr:GNAT family N-acetyltransferase [Cryobacterium ruanii]
MSLLREPWQTGQELALTRRTLVIVKCVSVRLGDPEVVPLLLDLHREYETRYGDGDSVHDVDGAEFEAPSGGFLVLVDGDTTVAGGGLRQFNATTAEVKRMWTNPAYRRQGHARTILRELESLARSLGYERMRLETGYAQPEALALYRSLGFTDIGNYGIYEHASGFELALT